ncbi:MAG: flavin reductase family protein [Planctomycetota bacterium]|nr:flavin reductase family protein [Planctomycetota bacterium]
MLVDPKQVKPSEIYTMMVQTIAPRPIAWVSTVSSDGVSNLAPYSYFNGIGSKPASLMFSAVNKPDGTPKDTVRNILENRQFVVNIVPFGLAHPMVLSSADYEFGESEFAHSGMTEIPSQRVQAPSVKESPVHLECELLQTVSVGQGPFAATVVIGEIVMMAIDDEVLDEAGAIDPARLDAIGRLGGENYCRTTELFKLSRAPSR